MHVLILGMTESGKTTLARSLASSFKARGIEPLVYDPLGDRWPTEHVHTDPDHFVEVVRASRRCAVFVDEAAEAVGRFDTQRHWLATRARHYGHGVHFIAQRLIQIAPTVRDQTGALALFRVGLEDAVQLAREWARPELIEAARLRQGEFLWTTRFGELQRLALRLPTAPARKPEATSAPPVRQPDDIQDDVPGPGPGALTSEGNSVPL